MPYGLLSTGFAAKPLETITEELAAAQRASPALGEDWDTSAESPSGQLNATVAAQLAAVWELAGAVFRSRDPRAATFAGLDSVCALTGTTRRAATKGTVTLTVTLGAGVTLPAGSIAHVAGQPTNRWVTTASATNSTGSTTTVSVAAEAETAGVVVANAGTISVIATPVTGWTIVTNASAAAPGSAAESDVLLRARRDRELRAAGTSPLDAIRAALSAVSGVTSVSIVENDTDATDPETGVPPHAIMCVVQGGTDAAVAAALWASRAAGIRTWGSTSVTLTDAGGWTRTVRFERPAAVNVYAEVSVVYTSATYAGDAAVQAAAAAVTTGALSGGTLKRSSIISAALAVAGVTDVTRVRLGRSSGVLFESNLLASYDEILTLADARVTVVVGSV